MQSKIQLRQCRHDFRFLFDTAVELLVISSKKSTELYKMIDLITLVKLRYNNPLREEGSLESIASCDYVMCQDAFWQEIKKKPAMSGFFSIDHDRTFAMDVEPGKLHFRERLAELDRPSSLRGMLT